MASYGGAVYAKGGRATWAAGGRTVAGGCAVLVRAVAEAEAEELRGVAKSRKMEARVVQRAQVIVALLDEPELSAGEASLRAGFATGQPGIAWVKRFNEQGLAGLQHAPRSGAPATHDEGVRSALIALARQKPRPLGYPFELWTLARLQTALAERAAIHLARSTIWEWLNGEGLAWKRQQSWFHEPDKHDNEFVEKRGPSWWPT